MLGFIGTSLQLQSTVTTHILNFARRLCVESLTNLYYSRISQSKSQSYITTDGQSASLSLNNAFIWGLWPDFCYCQTVAGLLIWGAISDKMTGLSFTIAAGPRQRSYFRVRVRWDLRPYFTVSDSRLPFRRLLRLAELRWRYSTPPAHGVLIFTLEFTNEFPFISATRFE
jgi:hypothetical protein